MTSRNYSSGFEAVLQLLGLSESDVKEKVVIPPSLKGSLRPDDPQSLAHSYQSNVPSATELLAISGIPPVEAPISLPATINVFAIGELVIGNW
ncbi:hypothetical protein [Xenorhabdus bovienii]|uniref:hypothetical protein n=1 Tax=Xenorhabdus bovienii TaxID=40576 RepID=UPI00237D175B|nr:hypothetical protein [Xenorhabdus bovienii]MDE1484523.1 hypothetical protein [Xenorhabdus bovienii]MDE9443322.1 hypothetical protein [Xenorhabdus bovienii]